MARERKLTWVHVVVVASIGTILEWWDFYAYSQLDKTLTTVFFGANSDDTGYWLIFGLSMAARPLGALLYGHIGDVYGRSRALSLGIMGMALGTVGIGVLPTYDTGSYSAGVASTILMGCFKCIQGLALGGEFGAATVYVSEMASLDRRALMTSILQSTSNIGLLLAVALVMVLQATVSEEDMLIWGWRIPFLLAFTTALLGWWMRSGMPEPHAFLDAARKEKLAACRTFSKRQLSLAGNWQVPDEEAADGAKRGGTPDKQEQQLEGGKPSIGRLSSSQGDSDSGGEGLARSDSREGEETFERAILGERSASLSRLHGDASHSKVPMIRMLRDNWAGVCIQILFTAWLTCSTWCVSSWMPSQLRKEGMSTRVSQGILLVAVVPNLLACYAVGWALDRGAPAVRLNMVVITVGTGVAFGTSYGAFNSTLAAWLLIPLLFTFCGAAFPLIGLPATRIYAPLERITGFSFAYACSTGLLGGFTPNISNALKASLGPSLAIYAGAFWLLIIWAATMIGCLLLRKYAPRIDRPYVGHIE